MLLEEHIAACSDHAAPIIPKVLSIRLEPEGRCEVVEQGPISANAGMHHLHLSAGIGIVDPRGTPYPPFLIPPPPFGIWPCPCPQMVDALLDPQENDRAVLHVGIYFRPLVPG